MAGVAAEDGELDEFESIEVLLGQELELSFVRVKPCATVVDDREKLAVEAEDSLEPLVVGILVVDDCIYTDTKECFS